MPRATSPRAPRSCSSTRRTPASAPRSRACAKSHGVAVIDYDRLTLGGSRTYYVSFDNVRSASCIGQGMVACVAAEKVAKPQLIVMKGDPTDNNATLFAQGYTGCSSRCSSRQVRRRRQSRRHVGPADGQDGVPAGLHRALEHQRGPHPQRRERRADHHLPPEPRHQGQAFPTTGQDATLVGLQNILSGYQCGTVYKPIYLEAQAAVALAMYCARGKTPPSSLANGIDPGHQRRTSAVPSVLLTPEWVTPANMNTTIIKDKFVPTAPAVRRQLRRRVQEGRHSLTTVR